MRLENKVALVTGAGSGFGECMAKTFAREGAEIAVVDINEEGAKRVAGEIGQAATPIRCDVTKADQIAATLETTLKAFGRVDIVINNAGWSHLNRPFMEISEEDYDRVFNVNVKSIFHMTRAIVPHWREKGEGGVILNIGSTAGIRPRPGLLWYNGSKGAVNLMSRSMAVELAPDKIRVNCLAPVMGSTPLLANFMGMPDTPENREKFLGTIPLGRMAEPQDVANAALYLCSDEAEFLTGVVLEVDGGRTI